LQEGHKHAFGEFGAGEPFEFHLIGQDVVCVEGVDDLEDVLLRYGLLPGSTSLRESELHASQELKLTFRAQFLGDEEGEFNVPLVDDNVLDVGEVAFRFHGRQFLDDLDGCFVTFPGLHQVLLDVVYFRFQPHFLQDLIDITQLSRQPLLEVVPGRLSGDHRLIEDRQVDRIGVELELASEDTTGAKVLEGEVVAESVYHTQELPIDLRVFDVPLQDTGKTAFGD
jgi:hypothetical protein